MVVRTIRICEKLKCLWQNWKKLPSVILVVFSMFWLRIVIPAVCKPVLAESLPSWRRGRESILLFLRKHETPGCPLNTCGHGGLGFKRATGCMISSFVIACQKRVRHPRGLLRRPSFPQSLAGIHLDFPTAGRGARATTTSTKPKLYQTMLKNGSKF